MLENPKALSTYPFLYGSKNLKDITMDNQQETFMYYKRLLRDYTWDYEDIVQ